MPLEITECQENQVTILICNGEIKVFYDAKILREKLRCLIISGRNKIVIDMTRTTRFEVSGIREILDPILKIRDDGGDIKLLSPNKRVVKKLEKLRLDRTFEIFNGKRGRQKAIASFS